MKFATGIEYHLKRGGREKFLKGGKVRKSELECFVKEKARICFCKKRLCEAASGIAGKCRTHRPYPATPDRL